jgi:hypothetical protein
MEVCVAYKRASRVCKVGFQKRRLAMLKYVLIALFFYNVAIFAQNYFPLEIGNRWDYCVTQIDLHHNYYDAGTFSFEITDKINIKNKDYFVVSDSTILFNRKYLRTENDSIFCFDISDSTDKYILTFDTAGVDNIDITEDEYFGVPDSQYHFCVFQCMRYSKKFGVLYTEHPNYWSTLYDLSGCIISGATYGTLVSTTKKANSNNYIFTLKQNYPNPFNPTTMIDYSIPIESKVKIEIFNTLGQSVGVLANDNKSAGYYSTTWNAKSLPSGIYFIHITANGMNLNESFTQVKKALLLK